MLNRLSRILLALVTAFVFTGQMEAAAAHCARLVAANEAATAPVQTETPPCHGDQATTAPAHHAPAHKPAKDRCECVAVLTACEGVATATASSRIEPYAWARPEAATFASNEPLPDLRPPRA